MAEPLPPTVAPAWTPRDDAWLRQPPSPFAGRTDRPLFIGACPRSGTTLLRVLLDNHPDLAIPHETNFVRPLWWQRHRFGDLRDPENRRAAAEWIFTAGHGGRRIRVKRIRRRDAVERVASAPPTVGSLVEACFALHAELQGKPRWGDKRPAYSGFIGMLFAMFPDAQYVNVVRDPRGAVASQVPMGWDEPDVAVPAAIARWKEAIRRTDRFARRLRPDQLLDVRYEDLTSEPERELRRICAFTGLRVDDDTLDAMLTGERRTLEGQFRGPHERLREPVGTMSVERWRERLTPPQVALVERATSSEMRRFGYRPAADIAASPDAGERRELRRRQVAARIEWHRSQAGELARRALYRRPVAAVRAR
jgi:hypothetical protein